MLVVLLTIYKIDSEDSNISFADYTIRLSKFHTTAIIYFVLGHNEVRLETQHRGLGRGTAIWELLSPAPWAKHGSPARQKAPKPVVCMSTHVIK